MSNPNHEQSDSTTQVFSSTMKTFVLPVLVVVGLIAFFAASMRPQMVSTASGNEALEARIQKVGAVQIKDANRAARSGEEVYKAQCSACHAIGAAGSPKFGDAGAWGARIGKGYDALLTSALKGKGNMGLKAVVILKTTRLAAAWLTWPTLQVLSLLNPRSHKYRS